MGVYLCMGACVRVRERERERESDSERKKKLAASSNCFFCLANFKESFQGHFGDFFLRKPKLRHYRLFPGLKKTFGQVNSCFGPGKVAQLIECQSNLIDIP